MSFNFIQSVFSDRESVGAVDRLFGAVLAAGAPDNVSVLVLGYHDDG